MKLLQAYQKIKPFLEEYYWIMLIPFMAYVFVVSRSNEQDINTYKLTTYGTVYDYRIVNKQFSKRSYKYKFTYKGRTYNGSSLAFKSDGIKKGSWYKVEFSHKNPENNRMVFDSEYIREFVIDSNGIVIDTSFTLIELHIKENLKKRLEKYKIDTLPNPTEFKN